MALNWFLNSAHKLILVEQSLPVRSNNDVDDQLRSKVAGGMGMELAVNGGGFQMPLHYPRYAKSDYEKMEEWKVDRLLRDYGLNFDGSLDEKKKFAMGAFLWPDQL